ncbi:hypothetical protein M0R45_023513 [Rubus argutus]|uniref:Uncharacterized protein n=1 Tax=Rubus argutus TaxID=59490 RepID=A0AAW1WNP4_RUBAR
MDNSNPNRKRARDDSEASPPESKLIRVDSSSSDANSGESSFTDRVDPDELGLDLDPAEAKMIQEDLLNILEDADTVVDRDPAIQGLDSVIKSFEEEIQLPGAPAFAPPVETTSGSGESSQPELGYLLEASDDELGLPPTKSEESKMEAADFSASSSETAAALYKGFENDMFPSYDAFDFGIGGYSESNGGGEYVALGGLFDYSDGGVSEVSWRTESLSAL